MSYKELTAFSKKVESISKSITRLQEKKATQLEKKNKAESERQELLIAEALNGVEADEKVLERLRKEIDACDAEIKELDGRIALIEKKRPESLAPDLPALEKGRAREIDKLKREADAKFEDARKIMYEYLLALQKVGQTRQQADDLHNDFLHHARMVDPEKYGHESMSRHPIPEYILFSDYTGEQYGVKESDQKAAINGTLSPQVLLYQLTGQLSSSNNQASELLRRKAK